MSAYIVVPPDLNFSVQEYDRSSHFVQITKDLNLVYLASCDSRIARSGGQTYHAPSTTPSREGLEASDFQDLVNEALYESDEFRMYGFKVTLCSRIRSHDWTSCPFAHHGEKARRRDPRQYNYVAIPCRHFRMGGGCRRGNACQFAHGVFEYWLHPAKYRTCLCNAGLYCERKVCFFAHTPEQLRTETNHHWCYVSGPVQGPAYTGRASTSGVVVLHHAPHPQPQTVPSVPPPSHLARPNTNVNPEMLNRLASLNIREGTSSHEESRSSLRWPQVQDTELPDIQWVSELVDET